MRYDTLSKGEIVKIISGLPLYVASRYSFPKKIDSQLNALIKKDATLDFMVTRSCMNFWKISRVERGMV
jgi:hypothetical protein